MDVDPEYKAGPLTFGIEIELHFPVLQAPANDPIQSALEFPASDWYERNCLFYSAEDGRKIPVVREDVQANKEARQAIWNELLQLVKETIERSGSCGSEPDIRVMTAETEHPKQTFKAHYEERKSNGNISDKRSHQNPNILGNFVDGHYEVYDSWTVCQDGSGSWYPEADGDSFEPSKIPPVGPKQYSWFSIEIKSRVYNDIDSFETDLKKACDRIRARFPRLCQLRPEI
ncbi:hypothetical protein GGR52DRAFT_589030 [Hypoxylon sp. FL1284]|nr:hypothetical protein GGR52DRAFT_589030 [Hypoxylon sp. FL1284]